MKAMDSRLKEIMESKLAAGLHPRDAWTLSVEQLENEIKQEAAKAAQEQEPVTKAKAKKAKENLASGEA